MTIKIYRLIPILLLVMTSCSGSDKEQRDIVAEWAGKEIVIPGELEFQVGKIPVDYDFDAADFKIVTYVDSSGVWFKERQNPERLVLHGFIKQRFNHLKIKTMKKKNHFRH